jgi:hypothetical protein
MRSEHFSSGFYQGALLAACGKALSDPTGLWRYRQAAIPSRFGAGPIEDIWDIGMPHGYDGSVWLKVAPR